MDSNLHYYCTKCGADLGYGEPDHKCDFSHPYPVHRTPALNDSVAKIASALTDMVILMRERLEKEFPAKAQPRDVILTSVPTEEEELRESQGSTGEPLDKWTSLGPREREFEERESGKGSKLPT